ncbi:hypothetical protein NQ318_001904 [Aromia moschata]|uniref:C2H2-type domain-containing protein n=1 Tax=Aromia moschata TaxID=1265417 RepID=A0AAV8Z1J5_9CUCU|nr:hypothetical protein NQ318_001904 [Aromia moschata]
MASTSDKEMITMAEEELYRLQRQLRIMEDDRVAFSEESRSRLEKQRRIIQTLKGEKQNLLEDINVANCANQKRKDERLTKRIDRLLEDYETYDKWVRNEKDQMKELEIQIKKSKLCLFAISENFEELDTCKIDMLKIISVNLNLSFTEKPVLCSCCFQALQRLFDFKTNCLSNDDYLRTFLPCDISVKLILEEIIYRNTFEVKIKCEEERVCRLCLRYFDIQSFTQLDNIEDDIFLKDMMQKCLAEIDLCVTHSPRMCEECMENLQSHFNFVICCLDNDEKIKNYAVTQGTDNDGRVDLNNVLKYIENMKDNSRNMDVDLSCVKTEGFIDNFVDVKGDAMVKEEFEIPEQPEFQVKVEESYVEEVFNPTERTDDSGHVLHPTTTNHTRTIFKCTICPHETNRRDSLELHALVHKELPKSELLKCDSCNFVTKWRSSLSIHVLLHKKPEDIVMFKCATCSYQTKYKKHLRRHCKKHFAVKAKSFECDCCPFKTGDKWYFKQHCKKKHDEDVVLKRDCFSCSKCLFETPYKSELNTHRKKAHNLTKYLCECGYTTQRLYHFKSHSLTHKKMDEVPVYKCEMCDFQSKHQRSLRNHVLLHKEGRTPKKGGRRKKKE